MANLTISVNCPACGKPIEAAYVGKKRDLLKKILQEAGHQPGDDSYKQIMHTIAFPDEP